MKSTAEELKNLSIEIGNQSNENKPIVTAPLNLNSSWEWQSNHLDHPHHHPVKLLGHFQATQEANFRYATLFWPN